MQSQFGTTSIFFLLIFAIIIFNTSLAAGASYDLVRDRNGEPLGLNYERIGKNIRGELGISRDVPILLFVKCEDRQLKKDEKFMRRRTRNCQNELAIWPKDLLKHITVALNAPVNLTGPAGGCGICMPKPFQVFKLPSGIEIIPPELLKQINIKKWDQKKLDKLPHSFQKLPSAQSQDSVKHPPKILKPGNLGRKSPTSGGYGLRGSGGGGSGGGFGR